jgi:hypothetical protein
MSSISVARLAVLAASVIIARLGSFALDLYFFIFFALGLLLLFACKDTNKFAHVGYPFPLNNVNARKVTILSTFFVYSDENKA